MKTNDKAKGNIFRASIISQEYTRGGINNYTISCRIRFYNPYINSIQSVTGVAKCHPEDVMSIKTGKHISESRAKVLMYKALQQTIVNTLSSMQNKYYNFEVKELKHIHELIHG